MTAIRECSPYRPLAGFPGMSALPSGQSRRLARSGGSFVGGVATDLDPCGARINPLGLPPAPPHDGNPAAGGQTGRERGRTIAFCNAGGRRMRQKPVDDPLCNLATPRGTKQTPHTVNFENPRVVPFCPRVWSFLTRVCSCVFAAPPVSISLFSLRKESERGGNAEKLAIHGFLRCLKKHPRVCRTIHGFSGDEKRGRSQCWRGFAGFSAPIHASTGRNAYTFLETVRNER